MERPKKESLLDTFDSFFVKKAWDILKQVRQKFSLHFFRHTLYKSDVYVSHSSVQVGPVWVWFIRENCGIAERGIVFWVT